MIICERDSSYEQVFSFDSWPDISEIPNGAVEVQFRLIYQGELPASGQGRTRAREKHQIRKALHKQLKELWATNTFLNIYFKNQEYLKNVGDKYALCNHRFVPLISEEFGKFGDSPMGLACGLDILFLRRDHPPIGLVKEGGDIDNRIKVLFDALRVPDNCSGIGQPDSDEDPFFCLLQNDNLITEVKVASDKLLTPLDPGANPTDVHLIIQVRTLVIGASGFTAFIT